MESISCVMHVKYMLCSTYFKLSCVNFADLGNVVFELATIKIIFTFMDRRNVNNEEINFLYRKINKNEVTYSIISFFNLCNLKEF